MASSSGSWLFIIILLIAGAVLIVSANEANYGYLKAGKDLKVEGGKIISDFVGKFSTSENKPSKESVREPAPPPAKARPKTKITEDQKDSLGTRDRAELGELLDKVGQ